MRTAEPPQIHSEADEGAKGVMMVDSPPHQPQKKKKQLLLKLAGRENVLILAVNGLAVNGAPPLCIVSKVSFTFL